MKLIKLLFAALRQGFWLGFLSLALAGYATQGSAQQTRDYLPGGASFYSYGVSQSKANFENIEIAQSYYSLYSKQNTWINIYPGKAPSMINLLQAYFPLNVRWQFKDGRQFILENIDIRGIMREYFKINDIPLPWQKEGRPKAKSGDLYPSMVHEVKDDTILIKWLVITNRTPVNERFTASGAAVRWDFSDEEFIVTTLKGVPTQGIDFKKKWEFNCPGSKCIKE
jgi:hypothetical protein